MLSFVKKRIRTVFWRLNFTLRGAKVGEVLLNNVDRDGTMFGYDIDLIKYVKSKINIPLIVAGGASSPHDCTQAIKACASAVSAASIFHFTSITPRLCKEDMHLHGIPARI